MNEQKSSGYIEIRFMFDYEYMPILGEKKVVTIAEQAGFKRGIADSLTLSSPTASEADAQKLIQALNRQIPWFKRAVFKVFVIEVQSDTEATYLLHQE